MLSAYTYSASNPLRYVDPDGRDGEPADGGFRSRVTAAKNSDGQLIITFSALNDRESPKVTFGSRFSASQAEATAESFKKHNDRAERFTTILAFDTKGDTTKIRVFGITVKEVTKETAQQTDNAAPNAGPGQPAEGPQADPLVAADVNGTQAPPGGVEAGDLNAAQVQAADDLGVAAAPQPNNGSDGNDAPATQPQQSRDPAAASPAAKGPDALE